MSVSRRKLFGAVALAGPLQAVEPQEVSLSAERLREVEPVWASRRAQRESLRAFEIAESVEPTQGIRRK